MREMKCEDHKAESVFSDKTIHLNPFKALLETRTHCRINLTLVYEEETSWEAAEVTLWRKVAESHPRDGRRDYGKQGRDNANHIKLMCSTSTSLCRRRLHWLHWSEALFCKSNAAICSAVQQDNACWHGQTTFSYFESQIFKRFSLLLCSKMISQSLNTNLWNQRLNLPDRQTPTSSPVLSIMSLFLSQSFSQASSVEAWCSSPSIRFRRLRAFLPYRAWPSFLSIFFPVSESACGLKLFKCSLLRTSCFITYLLDFAVPYIFSQR